MTDLRIETLTLPGAPVGEENPLPFFRDANPNLCVRALNSLPEDKRLYLGWQAGFRVLPYRMQDGYTRKRGWVHLKAAVLENEFLRAVFLPEAGGRLYSLVWKPADRELLHRNPVFQPANLAIRNAWFSGGIEWNLGHFGHAFTTCSSLFAARIQGLSGSSALRLYEFERCKGLFWQVDFHLPPGLPFLLAHVRVANPNPVDASMYWWTNIAVEEGGGVRVLAPARQAIYAAVETGEFAFGLTDLPGLPSLGGADGTYPFNSTFANEFFFQCEQSDLPFEAALDAAGSGLVEASTPRLCYRKLFVWGSHAGGRHWQEFLSQPGQSYLEIQAGLAPTQLHGMPMPARSEWDWTQAFGFLQADPARVHGANWEKAWREADAVLRSALTPARLAALETACRPLAVLPPEEFLHYGSGWGALEAARAGDLPAGFVFPAVTLGSEQQKWLALLRTGALPVQDPADLPGEWMIQPEWEALLEASPRKNWLAWLHLGVMRMERFDEAGAEQAWRASLAESPSTWAHRNLAVLYLRRGDAEKALEAYYLAWKLACAAGEPPAGLAVEYLRILQATNQAEMGSQAVNSLPAGLRDNDRIQILRGQFALALGDLGTVEEVLAREFAEVREGETTLTDLWFELHARREAERSGRRLDEALRAEVRRAYPPPARIDFRSFAEG